jgi:hypothetical protein
VIRVSNQAKNLIAVFLIDLFKPATFITAEILQSCHYDIRHYFLKVGWDAHDTSFLFPFNRQQGSKPRTSKSRQPWDRLKAD